MTQLDFDKGMVVAATWRLAASNDVMELLAVACVIRNHVYKLGARGYGDAINRLYALREGRLRPLPSGNEPQLVDYNEGLLQKVDEVYDNVLPDVTSTAEFQRGAATFANLRAEAAPQGRRLIGQFGTMHFYE